jgi:hypothetical protein
MGLDAPLRSILARTVMTAPSLPEEAFLPKRPCNEHERLSFLVRRNRMFSLCTPAEQQCLTELARWYATVRLELFAKPNLFTESYSAWFNHRYSFRAKSKLNPITLGLSKASLLIYKIERRLGLYAQSRLITRMRSIVGEDEIDRLVVVTHFFRMLPLDFGIIEQRAFENRLDALMGECLASGRISAVRRFDAVRRCVAWSYEGNRYEMGMSNACLSKHVWPLLLEVAQEDMESAVHLIDAHWNQTRPPQILMTLHLHEQSELAYKLAVKLKPHRVDFAAGMLCVLVFDASYQVKKVDQPAADVLGKIIEASCQLLAAWTFERSWTASQGALRSIDHLLRFGDPQADYWSKLAAEGLTIMKTLPEKELDRQLRLLAQVVFYSVNSAVVREGFELFIGCIKRRLDVKGDWEWFLTPTIEDVSQSLSILEDKVMSMRNQRIKANPNHPLLNAVEQQLEVFLADLQSSQPASGLTNIVSLTLALTNETLIRKFHQILREEFEMRAREFPVDAGLALKSMIQHCGYSQMDDEEYRKDLCKESYNALLPILECISSSDAAVARTGVGWSPRQGW